MNRGASPASLSPAVSDDAELFDRWSAGDREAGDRLLRRHFPTVYKFLRNKVAGGVEDLIQATFLACVQAKARFRRESSFRAFLLGLARLELFAHYRRTHRDERIDGGVTALRDLGASPTAALVQREEQRVLLEAMCRIPLDLQIVLELFYWERLTSAELGVVLDIPAPTVRSRLRRAKAALVAEIPNVTSDPLVRGNLLTDFDAWASSLRKTNGE
jgi:RNA polymerase sigma factor (sigma-70 family)